MTSHDVVNRLRKITGERSIGHLGTLDPMATGVLPLLMGKYTRLAQYFSAAEKSYTGHDSIWIRDRYLRCGRRASGAGHVAGVRWQGDIGSGAQRRGALSRRKQQMPPAFSAKKIGGKPAYKLAREGKPPELTAAKVRIDCFEISAMEDAEARFKMTISCGRLCAVGCARAGPRAGLWRASGGFAADAGRGFHNRAGAYP